MNCSSELTLSICCMFCTRNLCALYQGRNTSLIISFTPFSWNLRVSALTTGELIRYSLTNENNRHQCTHKKWNYWLFLNYEHTSFLEKLIESFQQCVSAIAVKNHSSQCTFHVVWRFHQWLSSNNRRYVAMGELQVTCHFGIHALFSYSAWEGSTTGL